jgi:deoxycytidine triphosphate deaminase
MSVLAREAISERLWSDDPERQIFRPESWDIRSLRGAAYDLRVAHDYLILPDGSRYWPGAPDPVNRAYTGSFELRPGEVAFVSSAEKLCMPWDLTANIAPKFRLALGGLLVMGGMLVDPGYGRVMTEDGETVSLPDGERLHFQLVNLGVKNLAIEPGRTCVAAIQFITLDGNPCKSFEQGSDTAVPDLGVPSSERLLRDLFHPHAKEPLPQLAFFSKTAGLGGRVESVEEGVARNEIRIEVTERANDRVLVYGVLVILITLLGASFAAIVSAI